VSFKVFVEVFDEVSEVRFFFSPFEVSFKEFFFFLFPRSSLRSLPLKLTLPFLLFLIYPNRSKNTSKTNPETIENRKPKTSGKTSRSRSSASTRPAPPPSRTSAASGRALELRPRTRSRSPSTPWPACRAACRTARRSTRRTRGFWKRWCPPRWPSHAATRRSPRGRPVIILLMPPPTPPLPRTRSSWLGPPWRAARRGPRRTSEYDEKERRRERREEEVLEFV
jgi:hypothetical protein